MLVKGKTAKGDTRDVSTPHLLPLSPPHLLPLSPHLHLSDLSPPDLLRMSPYLDLRDVSRALRDDSTRRSLSPHHPLAVVGKSGAESLSGDRKGMSVCGDALVAAQHALVAAQHAPASTHHASTIEMTEDGKTRDGSTLAVTISNGQHPLPHVSSVGGGQAQEGCMTIDILERCWRASRDMLYMRHDMLYNMSLASRDMLACATELGRGAPQRAKRLVFSAITLYVCPPLWCA